MGKIDDSARLIIKISVQKIGRTATAKLYHITLSVIDLYLMGVDQGTLIGREVIRMEIGRKQAEKDGKKEFKVTEKDRYKGGRKQ
jgi:hypothetical protein